MANERTYWRDSEWAEIEGKLCLVKAFLPLSGKIVNGVVVDHDQAMPYANVVLKVAGYDGDSIGYITNKLDFAILWAAFKDNYLALDGVRREPPLPSCSDLGKLPHEVWLVWSQKRYTEPANSMPKVLLSKLIVVISGQGNFDQFAEMPQYAALESLVAWIPEIRLTLHELALVRHERHVPGPIKLLLKVWDDVVTPT